MGLEASLHHHGRRYEFSEDSRRSYKIYWAELKLKAGMEPT